MNKCFAAGWGGRRQRDSPFVVDCYSGLGNTRHVSGFVVLVYKTAAPNLHVVLRTIKWGGKIMLICKRSCVFVMSTLSI